MATFRIKGTRDLGSTVEFYSAIAFVEYPTSTTWHADIVIEPSVTEYLYRFLKRSGAYSPYQTATFSRVEETPQSTNAYNELDHWGVRFDTARLNNESNSSYKTRLLDVFVHKGGSNHEGLVNAITRDFNLDYTDTGLLISKGTNTFTGEPFDLVWVEITSTKVRVRTPDFLYSEKFRVSGSRHYINLTYKAQNILDVKTEDEIQLDYIYDEVKNRLDITEDAAGKVVTVIYTYVEEVSRLNTTLSELKTGLENIVTPYGDQVLDVTVATGYDSESAEKLNVLPETIILEYHNDLAGNKVSGLPIRWSDMRIQIVWDPELQETLKNWSGSLWNTKIDTAFRGLYALSRSTWGTAVADKSFWGSDNFPIHGGQVIVNIYDPPLGWWENVSNGTRYDQWEIARNKDGGSASYRGLSKKLFKSGPTHKRSLRVGIGVRTKSSNTGSVGVDIVSDIYQDPSVPSGNAVTEGGVDI